MRYSLPVICALAQLAYGAPTAGEKPTFAGPSTYTPYPPLDYEPHPAGINYSQRNSSIQPWNHLVTHPAPARPQELAASSCSKPTESSGSPYWMGQIEHNGLSSFNVHASSYPIWRDVTSSPYNADNSGNSDASGAIQNAINAGAPGGPDRTSNSMGTTGQDAVVYLPSGTYLLDNPLQLYVGTVLIGDPTNPPVLKASSGFSDDHIIYGKDPNHDGTVNFYITVKNLVIDSTNIPKDNTVALLDWTVSQGTQLTNVVFNMPNYSTGHTGLTTAYGYSSNTYMGDLTFNGGVVGMNLNTQQFAIKGVTFSGTTTGVMIQGCTDCVFLDCTFENAATGIAAGGDSGSIALIDSSAHNVGTLMTGKTPYEGYNNVILENIVNDAGAATFATSSSTLVSGSISDTWVLGQVYNSGNTNAQADDSGSFLTTSRASALLGSNGKYFTKAPPKYEQYAVDQFINLKSVPGYPVYGDGQTDDTANINAILSMYAGCKVIYWPDGTYIVTNTINIPNNSRIFGEGFATISAVGSNFYNPNAPTTMVQVGNAGDVGTVQIQNMILTTADVLQGCLLLQVNVAGTAPGDVGMWNVHFRIGGAAGSKVETNCGGTPDQCKAAWGVMELTASSSVYIEDSWGWTADHDLDGGNGQTISTGRGALVQATKGTWLIGTAQEHHTLYQYNFNGAENVFAAMSQSETPYWQGPGGDAAPAPWTNNLISSDPTFSHCGSDAICAMAWFQLITNCSDMFLYGGGVWAFYNGGDGQSCSGTYCQKYALEISGSASAIYLYGLNVHSIEDMVRDGSSTATSSTNAGGWGGCIGAYLYST